jgi:hypothetical protein
MCRVQRTSWTLSARRTWALGLACFGLMFGGVAPRAQAFVYWADSWMNSIGRADSDGTNPDPSFITGTAGPIGIALDDSHIYWANLDSNSIGRANLDGSDPDQEFIRNVPFPQGVAVAGPYIYWTSWNSLGSKRDGQPVDTIGRANIGGTDVEPNFITGLTAPGLLSVIGDYIYWANTGTRSIGRAARDGSDANPRFLTDTGCPSGAKDNCPLGVTRDPGDVYWTNPSDNEIWRESPFGPQTGPLIKGARFPYGVVVTVSHIFWSNDGFAATGASDEGSIGEANIDGSAVNENFIPHLAAPQGLAVDAGVPTPSLTSSATQSATVGGQISDMAFATGGDSPTGTVGFELFGPDDPTCSDGPVSSQSAPLIGGSASSAPVTVSTPGVYQWVASYGGDENNGPISGQCGDSGESSTVTAVPSLLTEATPGAPLGGAISDTAFVSGGDDPTGTVSFELFGSSDPTCSGSPVSSQSAQLLDGIANSAPVPVSTAGVYHWIASYSGDQDNSVVSGHCGDSDESSTVSASGPSLSTAASSVTLPGELDDQATLSGLSHDAGGTISFSLYGPSDPSCAGSPLFKAAGHVSGNGTYGSGGFAPPGVGAYRWVVAYGGDQTNPPISGRCGDPGETSSVSVKQTPGIVSRATASAALGSAISDIAGLAGGRPATGTITFSVFAYDPLRRSSCVGKPLATTTVPVSGNVAQSGPFTPTAPGFYVWFARYSGDANNNPVGGACGGRREVSKVYEQTTIAYTGPITGVVGRPVTLTARLFTASGGAQGDSVTISFGAETCSAATDATGSATCEVTPHDRPGSYRIIASFVGTTTELGSTDTSQSFALTAPGKHRSAARIVSSVSALASVRLVIFVPAAGRLTATAIVPAARAADATSAAAGRGAHPAKPKPINYASASRAATHTGLVTIILTPSTSARKTLAERHRLTLVITITYTPTNPRTASKQTLHTTVTVTSAGKATNPTHQRR